MGLKTTLAGATFPYTSTVNYQLVISLRMKSKGFFSGEDGRPGSGEVVLRPPLQSVWVGQTRMHWLPYCGGFVTALRLRDAPILTGKMSGCPLSVFSYDGEPHLGHIGTVDDEEANAAERNAAVKSAWYDAVARGRIRPLRAWSPLADVAAGPFAGMPHIFGMANAQGKAYSIRCTEAMNTFTIADIRNANTTDGVQCVRTLLNAGGGG